MLIYHRISIVEHNNTSSLVSSSQTVVVVVLLSLAVAADAGGDMVVVVVVLIATISIGWGTGIDANTFFSCDPCVTCVYTCPLLPGRASSQKQEQRGSSIVDRRGFSSDLQHPTDL